MAYRLGEILTTYDTCDTWDDPPSLLPSLHQKNWWETEVCQTQNLQNARFYRRLDPELAQQAIAQVGQLQKVWETGRLLPFLHVFNNLT